MDKVAVVAEGVQATAETKVVMASMAVRGDKEELVGDRAETQEKVERLADREEEEREATAAVVEEATTAVVEEAATAVVEEAATAVVEEKGEAGTADTEVCRSATD